MDLSYQELISNSRKRAMEKRKEKHACQICGKPELNWSLYSKYSYYRSNFGHPTAYSGVTDFVVCSEPCRREYVKQGNIRSGFLMEDVEIPKRIRGACLEWWNNPEDPMEIEIYDKMTNWLKEPNKGWFFAGTTGSGKSCLAVALVRELRRFEKKVLWLDFSKLITTLGMMRNYRPDALNAALETYSSPDVVVLDEFRKVGVDNAFSEELFQQLLATWHSMEKLVIITTNSPEDELKSAFHPRVISRIAEMCKLCRFIHEDYRTVNE